MTNQVAFRYGALELRSLYPTFALRGIFLATALHVTIIGGYYFAESIKAEEPAAKVVSITLNQLPQPPSITKTGAAPAITVAAPSAEGAKASPVMVPDAEVSPEKTIAPQPFMNNDPTTNEGEPGNGGNLKIDIPPGIESESEPPPFSPVEKQPVPVYFPPPGYPEIALKAGIEGTVYVRVWVTKEGRVKKVEVLSSSSDILSAAAIEAASKWVFTPAIMNNGPVSVWMSIPFKFGIRNAR